MKKLISFILLSSFLTAQTMYWSTSHPNHERTTIIDYNPSPYIGIGYGLTNVEDDYLFNGTSEITAIDFSNLLLQLGYQINPFIALEFRYIKSVGTSTYDLYTNSDAPETGSYNDMNSWGIYFKPKMPLGGSFSIYALMGFASTTVDGKSQWSENLLDAADFSWGMGLEVEVVDNVAFFIDYTTLYNDFYDIYYSYEPSFQPQLTDVDNISFGFNYSF